MVSDNRTPVTEGLRTLAKMYERTADVYEAQADSLDILLEQEQTADLDEPISPRPPNPDEYRLFAQDHRVQARLFREAADRMERGEATPDLRDAVREFTDNVTDEDSTQFALRDSFM